MGGIAPVNYNGQEVYIDQSNAKEIYKAYRKGEVELDTAQQHYVEKFLSDEDIDEIEYDQTVNKQDGKGEVDDAEKAESHSGQGGNVAASTAGTMASVAATTALASVASLNTGFVALVFSLGAAVCAGASLVAANEFDSGYEDRVQAGQNADATNEIIDQKAAGLEESMEMMNEDVENYEAKNEEMSVNMNVQVGQMADLQIQLQEAQAAGNKKRVAEIQAEIASLQGVDFSEDQAELEETRAGLEEYSAFNSESVGVMEGGTSVSDFLKEGLPLGIVATANVAILLLGSIAMYMGSKSHVPKIWTLIGPIDGPASVLAKITYAICGALFGAAAYKMGDKAKNEFECGSAGNGMDEHLGELSSMITQQEGYIEATAETYDASDEAEGESRDKGAEQAANLKPPGGESGPKDEKPVEKPVEPPPKPANA